MYCLALLKRVKHIKERTNSMIKPWFECRMLTVSSAESQILDLRIVRLSLCPQIFQTSQSLAEKKTLLEFRSHFVFTGYTDRNN